MQTRRISAIMQVVIGLLLVLLVGALAGAAVLVSNDMSASTTPVPAGDVTPRDTVPERLAPDAGCRVTDAAGAPLYDSQYEERTGHQPCALDGGPAPAELLTP